MKKLPNFGDERQVGFCVHCGGPTETQDHAPSKVFLDLPYPLTRPTVPSCTICNNGFSADEEYVACFIECVVRGTTDPDILDRDKVAKALRRNGSLRGRIERAKREAETLGGGRIITWHPEEDPFRRVALKLARCHAAYELNEPQLSEPDHMLVAPLPTLNDLQREHFETPPDTGVWPEVGSRAMQRLVIADGAYSEGWVLVQDERYRYMTVGAGSIMVRGVFSEYLAYEVIWDR
ncbi:hypothetical protein [Dongia sp.]|uniref:hypothetical protein n=1 Tax=Dongia sp. TaxID=1977262 RepID=UPI0035B0D089